MGIIIDGHAIREVYAGSEKIREIYHGSDLVWSAGARSRMDWQWDRARTEPLRILFVGSSTIQGHGVAWSEGLVYQLTGYLASHLPGVEAAPMVKRTSGSYRAVTDGFHFYGPDRQALVESFQPHIVVHMVGSNDYSLQRSLDGYRDDLVAVTNNVLRNAISGDTRQLFIHAPRREDVDDHAVENTWADYGRVLREVAEDTTRAEFLDAGALFDEARGDAEVFASDRVHLNERGNSILAQVIAEWWGLDAHEDEAIYGFDAAQWDHLDNHTRLASFTPDDVLQSGTRMAASGDYRPTLEIFGTAGIRSLRFDGGNRKMQTDDWGGVQALPLTVYVVVSQLAGGGGTTSQPLWSRSGVDNGYTWAWYDRDAGTLKAASGSALSPGTPIGGDLLTEPVVIAISFLPSGHSRIHLNSLQGQQVPVQSPDPNMGPWMRSLKLGTNYGEASWSQMNVREMWWHHGADPDTVANRIVTLAEKHDIPIIARAGTWEAEDNRTVTHAPAWADTLQIVAIGGGGGGAAGSIANTGEGGDAGTWTHTSIPVTAGDEFSIYAGGGGEGGNSSPGGAGGASSVTAYPSEDEILNAPGGAGGTRRNANTAGKAAGTYSAFGRSFAGGGPGTTNNLGEAPGAGGGPGNGGIPFASGKRGGRGRVWWRFVAH
ncbi:SGNH/GDSL hydrolase family protein [Corynebacterium glyciniphilum]|uniref:SGNH/GDSL hydrolase family protein n=1 Tax=Corynebacterium glyciniphilum TaxID=1404244 RepID=UPI0011AB7160|nr:GDSL-type esterase/lipase family protein [Corynebacterium glyciniphilum]